MRQCPFLLFFFSILALLPHSVRASYNTLPRADAVSLGMADANVALATGPAAQFINPANLVTASSTGSGWKAGGLFGRVQMGLTQSGSRLTANTEYPIIPFVAVGQQYSDRLAVGFGLDVPFGIGVEWDDGVFELDLGPLGRHDIAKEAEIRAIRLGPSVAWRANDAWSLGVRAFVHHVDAREISDLGSADGDGRTFGGQVGINYRGDKHVFAAAFTTRTHVVLEGTTTRIMTPNMPGEADIRLPARLQVGAAYRFAPDAWLEVDLDWIGWSYVNELAIKRADGTVLNEGRTERRYKDTVTVRAGLRWEKSTDQLLFAGIAHDPTPVPEQDVAPTVNNTAMTRIGFGASFLLRRSLHLDMAYQYVYGHSRRISETAQDDILGIDTGLFEGKYRSESHVVGITLGGSF